MDSNLHYALVAACNPDEVADELEGKSAAQAKKILGKMSAEGEVAHGLIVGPELFWNRISEGFTQLYGHDRSKHKAATIRDLSGVESHPEIELINFPFSAIGSLEPLRELTELRRLRLHVDSKCDLQPLEGLANLERVRLGGATSGAQTRVLRQLEQRGVQVDWPIEWETVTVPFRDRMLKLAVIGQLVERGLLELPKLFVIDEYELDEGNLALVLASLPDGDPRYASIESLSWTSGGFQIQHQVHPQWDGESEQFDITDLTGIEALPVLTKLNISPLAGIPKKQLTALRKRGVQIAEYQ